MLIWTIYIILTNEEILVPPSRRLCNASYIAWMVAYNLSLIVTFAIVQYYTGTKLPSLENYKQLRLFL